jgi:hypothetical protein
LPRFPYTQGTSTEIFWIVILGTYIICDSRRNTKQTNIYTSIDSNDLKPNVFSCNFVSLLIIIFYTYKSNISDMRFGILLRLLLVSRWQADGGAVFMVLLLVARWQAKRKQDISAFGHKNSQDAR